MLGRISPQKGPEFFRRAVQLSRASGLPLQWIWVGGGAPGEEAALREAGALVTGWLPRQAALERLAAADVYVHTAAWEGFPVSVPGGRRARPPHPGQAHSRAGGAQVPALCDTPEALVAAGRALLDRPAREALASRSRLLVERHQPAAQHEALERAYSIALGRSRGPLARRP